VLPGGSARSRWAANNLVDYYLDEGEHDKPKEKNFGHHYYINDEMIEAVIYEAFKK